MYNSAFLFGGGVLLLLVTSRVFIEKAELFSRSLRISPLIIGITVVAIGTSLPELVVSLIAALRKDSGLAIGNIVGSNIVNIFLVLPMGILIGKIRIGTTKTQRTAIIMAFVTALFVVLYLIGVPNAVSGGIMVFIALMTTIIEYIWGIEGREHEDAYRTRKDHRPRFSVHDLIIMVASLAGIIGGGAVTVFAVEDIAAITNFSTTILGLSLTAVATSLPELLITIFSQDDHQEKLTIGNIMGSNIYNLALIGGIISLTGVWGKIQISEIFMLLLSTYIMCVIVFGYKGKTIPMPASFVLLGLYVMNLYLILYS